MSTNKIGIYTTPDENVPAVITRKNGSNYDIMTLGYANTRKTVAASEFSFANGGEDTTIYVNSLDDFSSPAAQEAGITVSGSEITIPTGVLVVPVGVVDLGSSYITVNGAGAIEGRNAAIDGFLSTATGGVIRHSGGTTVMHSFMIFAPGGTGFVGTGSKANGDILKLRLIGVFSATSYGFDLTGYSVPSLESCYVGDGGMGTPGGGVIYRGTIGKVHTQATPFYEATDSCITLAADANIDEIDIAGNYYQAGVAFIEGVTGYTLNNSAEVTINVPKGGLQGPDIALVGIDRFDPKWNFQSNPDIPDSKALGTFYQTGTDEVTTITTQSQREKANITVAAGSFNQRFTVVSDGTMQYEGIRPRTGLVAITGRVEVPTNNQNIEFSVFKDGAVVTESVSVAKVATGSDERQFTVTALVDLKQPGWHDPVVTDCEIELYVANLSGTDDITLNNVTMEITT